MNSLGNKKIMAKNIQYYMNRNDIDRRKLSSDLNIKYTTLTDWINAKTYPRIDKIELLSNYFGISKSDLVEDSSHSSIPSRISNQNVILINRESFLKCLIENQFESIKDFALENNIPYETIQTTLKSGIEKEKIENIIKICNGLNISPEVLSDENMMNSTIENTIMSMLQMSSKGQHSVQNFAEKKLKIEKKK